MKNYLLHIACCLSLVIVACHSGKNKTATSNSGELYTCSMHPQVLQDHPGNCPICGMKLVKKNEAIATSNIELGTLLKPVNEFIVTSLPVTTPQQRTEVVPVKLYGTIEYDTRAAGTISSRVSGRIEKLYLRYRYQKVEAGQRIMDIYSPELLTAQQNLLFLLKSDPGNTPFIDAAKQRLLLLGMSKDELNKVLQTGKSLYTVGIYSKYRGHVHDAGMLDNASTSGMKNREELTQELSLKEGMYVQKGQALFMIMNHHEVWAALQIFPNEQGLVKKNDIVNITPESDTGATIHGKIDFIEPFFRQNSKTLTARVYFDNMNMLPVGSHVTAEVYSAGVPGLWLPSSAVVALGENEIVFMRQHGGFIAHKVNTGMRVNENIQISSGLNNTDTVAANAQYLIDSESFIKTNE